MSKRKIILTFLFVSFAALVWSDFTSAWSNFTPVKTPAACVEKDSFLVLENQRYALCATASCFTYNQVLYCGCDVLIGDSISLPLEFDNQNICDVNEQGKGHGFMVSTFSVPEDTVYPGGKKALYTCPGAANAGSTGFAAIGSYGQCDGGICFTSASSTTFPGLDQLDSGRKDHHWYWGAKSIPFPYFDDLLSREIICACPISTSCDGQSSRGNEGYQISGRYNPKASGNKEVGGCRPEDCEMCSAGEIKTDQCVDNPLALINQGTIIPVGALSGTPIALGCILLDGNVPDVNSCLCQCLKVENGSCREWTAIDQSPLGGCP